MSRNLAPSADPRAETAGQPGWGRSYPEGVGGSRTKRQLTSQKKSELLSGIDHFYWFCNVYETGTIAINKLNKKSKRWAPKAVTEPSSPSLNESLIYNKLISLVPSRVP